MTSPTAMACSHRHLRARARLAPHVAREPRDRRRRWPGRARFVQPVDQRGWQHRRVRIAVGWLTPLQNPPLINQVYIRQRQTNLTLLVSRAEGQLGGASDRDADNASISPDGLYVGFSSAGTGLSTEDNDGFLGLTPTRDVFVRDLIAGSTTLVSRKGLTATGGAGAIVNAPASEPFVGTTANFVLFTSEGDLAPLAVGKGTNVYSAKLQQPLSVTATPPATFGYRRFDTEVTCTSTCSIYATAQIKLTVGGVTSVKGSYMYGLKSPVQPNTPTKVAVQVYNTAISNWLKAGTDKGGTATITINVQATGLRGEKARTTVEAPFVVPVVPTPTPARSSRSSALRARCGPARAGPHREPYPIATAFPIGVVLASAAGVGAVGGVGRRWSSRRPRAVCWADRGTVGVERRRRPVTVLRLAEGDRVAILVDELVVRRHAVHEERADSDAAEGGRGQPERPGQAQAVVIGPVAGIVRSLSRVVTCHRFVVPSGDTARSATRNSVASTDALTRSENVHGWPR